MQVAIVLGGTSPHVELINKLKKRGYYTILIDYLDNCPGISVADEHIKESTLDYERIVEIARSKNANLVISACIDQANATCCYAAEKLALPKPYSYQTSLNVTDKGLMKKIMVDNNIMTSPYQLVSNIDSIKWENVIYPAVVKPVDCNSSKGVHRANSPEEVLKYVTEALKLSRNGMSIIEGFNQGEEIQVDCFAENDNVKIIMTRQKKKIVSENGMVLQSTGSLIPAPLPDEFAVQIREIAEKIAKSFHLRNTPFFYQAIVTTNGISVLEFAPRIGGGLSYYLINKIAGVDIVECAIDSFLNVPITINPVKTTKCYSTNLLYMKSGIFDYIDGIDRLKADGIICEAFQMKRSGTVIDSDMRSSNRVGAFVIEADSPEELYQKEKTAYANIKIIDKSGNDVLNRDVLNK